MGWKQIVTDNHSYEYTIYFISILSTDCGMPLGSLTMEQYFSHNVNFSHSREYRELVHKPLNREYA